MEVCRACLWWEIGFWIEVGEETKIDFGKVEGGWIEQGQRKTSCWVARRFWQVERFTRSLARWTPLPRRSSQISIPLTPSSTPSTFPPVPVF